MAVQRKEAGHRMPQSRDDVNGDIDLIGSLLGEIQRIKAEHEEEVRVLRAAAVEAVADKQALIAAVFQGLSAYAQTHRQEITGEGPKAKRSLALPAGKIGWRDSRESLQVKDDDDDAAVAELKELGLVQFVVTTESVDVSGLKKAMDKDEALRTQVEAMACLILVQGGEETFFVSPASSDISVTPARLQEAMLKPLKPKKGAAAQSA